MNAIRIHRRLDSPIPQLPELSGLVGKDVEIIVLESNEATTPAQPGAHFNPVGGWEGPAGEFDRLMGEVVADRDADLEPDRESLP